MHQQTLEGDSGEANVRIAIVDEGLVTIEKRRLPLSWLAQACELYPLKQALEILTQGRGTVYTDSKYAFRVVHTFGKI